MKVIGIVYGSAEQAKPVVVSTDTVYVHTNIEKYINPENPDAEQYKYQETQYELNEYLQVAELDRLEHQSMMENAICEADKLNATRMSDIENAMCEQDTAATTYIYATGLTNDVTAYISDIQGTNDSSFIIKGNNGSSFTYYADFGQLLAKKYGYFGGSWDDNDYTGAFYFILIIQLQMRLRKLGVD